MKNLIQSLLKEKNLNKRRVEYLKRNWVRKNKISKLPLNSEILGNCTKDESKKLKSVLLTKPTRTLSGVSIIAIMPKPMGCPGNCTYCPTSKNAPKSYTGFEPSSLRAIRNKYNPYKTVTNRLTQLQKIGHDTSKNEVIVQGGTFPALPWKYQKEYIRGAFDGFNGKVSKTLAEAQKLNETTKNRVVGLTIETRPDWVFPKKFLELGCTRVEMGLQNTDDKILKKVNRGHTVKQFTDSVAELKSHAFKVLYHIMPGLPGSTFKSDLKMFKELFDDERFRPDMMKIYPTLVLKNTKLYKEWKAGEYKPINEEYMEKLLTEVMKMCPKWCRIMRVQRDIPAQFIEAGPVKSNIREIVDKSLDKSKEIRFREVGHVYQRTGKLPKKVEILEENYKASGGTEYFISAEDVEQDILLGFCRLRIQNDFGGARRSRAGEVDGGTGPSPAMIRELHVYGSVVPIGKYGDEVQHKGLGRKLMARAEEIAKKSGKKEIIVISGVGVREYYKMLGYEFKDWYMWKSL